MADEEMIELLPEEPMEPDREADKRYGKGRRGVVHYYDDVYDGDGRLMDPISILD